MYCNDICISICSIGETKSFLVDGGKPKYHQSLFQFLRDHCLVANNQAFRLDGIVVTHSDNDHSGGILQLFKNFPPNTKMKDGWEFIFDGPLLLTKSIENGPSELYSTMINFRFEEDDKVNERTTDLGFGPKFSFAFGNDHDILGVAMNFKKSCKVSHDSYERKLLSPTSKYKGGKVCTSTPKTSIAEVDTSPTNLSSIITTYKSCSSNELAFLLSGDTIGHKVINVLQSLRKENRGGLPHIKFFHVPHHGSSRNNLPWDKTLNMKKKLQIVHDIIKIYLILGLTLNDGKLWSDKDKSYNLAKYVLNEKSKYFLDNKWPMSVGQAWIKILKDNESIIPTTGMSKPKYVYDQAQKTLCTIYKNLEEYESVCSNQSQFGNSILRTPELFEDLYSTTMEKVKRKIKHHPQAIGILEDKDNVFAHHLETFFISLLYKNISADVYYISSGTNNGHPSSSTLSGIIKAAVAKNHKCTLLLSSSSALVVRHLPDVTSWKHLVTLRYFTNNYAIVNLKDSIEFTFTECFNPVSYDSKILETLHETLNNSLTLNYSTTTVHIRTGSQSDSKYIALEYNLKSKQTFMITTETKEILFLKTEQSSPDLKCILYKNNKYEKSVFLKPHQSSSNTKPIYAFFEVETDVEKYWVLPSEANTSRLSLIETVTPQYYYFFPVTSNCGSAEQDGSPGRKDELFVASSLFANKPSQKTKTTSKTEQTVIENEDKTNTRKTTKTVIEYQEGIGMTTPHKGILAQTFFEILLGKSTTKHLNDLTGPNKTIATALSLPVNDNSTVTLSSTGKVLSSSVKLNIPEKPIFKICSAAVSDIKFEIDLPRTLSLKLTMVVSLQSGDLITFNPLKVLKMEDQNLTQYLKNVINYPTDIDRVILSDMAMLLTRSYSTGVDAFTSLPLALAGPISKLEVNREKSFVNAVTLDEHPTIISATIVAIIPEEQKEFSLTFGQFSFQVKELFLSYSTQFNHYYQITGRGMLSLEKLQEEVVVTTQPALENTNTPELQIQFSSESNVCRIFTFMDIDQTLMDVTVPFFSKALQAIDVQNIGFKLKQGIRDSADNYYLHSLYFNTSLSDWSSFLPSCVACKNIEDVNCKVILVPHTSNPSIGFECEFLSSLEGQYPVEMPCKVSILPVSISLQQLTAVGYTCLLDFSTHTNSEHNQFLEQDTISNIISSLGFEKSQKFYESIPVLSSLLTSLSLNHLQLMYNTAEKYIQFLELQLSVPLWTLVGSFSVQNMTLNLQFSSTVGWLAGAKSRVLLNEFYYIDWTLTLPTCQDPGKLSFTNSCDNLTVGKFLNMIDLDSNNIFVKLPSLGMLDFWDSILDITVRDVTMGLRNNQSTLSLNGAKFEFHLEELDLQLFQLRSVRLIVAYNPGSGVSFRAYGFINQSIFVEIAFDSSKKIFKGKFEITQNHEISIKNATEALMGDVSIKPLNHVYETISEASTASTYFTLRYDSTNKSINLISFTMDIQKDFELFFGKIILGQFSFQFIKSQKQPQINVIAFMLNNKRDSGLQLTFDCTVKGKKSNMLNADISPIPGKKLSLLAFLKLDSLPPPILPKPSSTASHDRYLDLALKSGSISFCTDPKQLQSFEITTVVSSTERFLLLKEPMIELVQIYLTASYNALQCCEAKIYGSLMLGKYAIILAGSHSKNRTVFCLNNSNNIEHFKDLIKMTEPLLPNDFPAAKISKETGLPSELPGYFSILEFTITPELKTFRGKASITLEHWDIHLPFVSFSASKLHALVSWEKPVNRKNTKDKKSNKEKHSFFVSASLVFDSVPVDIQLNVCSTGDKVLHATVQNSSALELKDILDNTFEFAHKQPPSSSSLSYLKLRPKYTNSIKFSSAYIQINLTERVFILFGKAIGIGSCLLFVGSTSTAGSYGYAVTLALTELASILPSLAGVNIGFSFENISAAITNTSDWNSNQLIKAIKSAEETIVSTTLPKLLPFQDSLVSSDSEFKVQEGLSLYCRMKFNKSTNPLLTNFVTIMKGKEDKDVMLFAQYQPGGSTSETVFIANIPSIGLLGALIIDNVSLELRCHFSKSKPNLPKTESCSKSELGSLKPEAISFKSEPCSLESTSGTSNEEENYKLSLSGDIKVDQFPSTSFHGFLQITKDNATFCTSGGKKINPIQNPLGMFGIEVNSPKLSVAYTFGKGVVSSLEVKLIGSVDFHSDSSPDLSTTNKDAPLTLAGQCVWVNRSPSLIIVELKTEKEPLTLSKLTYTVFKVHWNSEYLNIGLFNGKLYYASQNIEVKSIQFKQGYHIACKTFLFKEKYGIDVEFDLDNTGFSASGSAANAIDLGFAKFSTSEIDKDKKFLNKGPTLAYTHSKNKTDISLDMGITFLDVQVGAANLSYTPPEKAFHFKVSYPGEILGIEKPSITGKWSKGGIAITSWDLGTNIPGMEKKLIKQIGAAANVKTKQGCAAIANFILRQSQVLKISFSMSMKTANKADWKNDDLIAFTIKGNCHILIGGNNLSTIDIADVIIHIHKVRQPTMASVVASLIEDLATTVATQIIEDPKNLARIVPALAFNELIKQGKNDIIKSLICRGLDEEDLDNAGNDAKNELEKTLDDAETKAADAEKKFLEGTFDSAESVMKAATAYSMAIASYSGTVTSLAAVLSFIGISTPGRHEKKEHQLEAFRTSLQKGMTKYLQITSFHHTLREEKLSFSWSTKQIFTDMTYFVEVKVKVDEIWHTYKNSGEQHNTIFTVNKQNIMPASTLKINITAGVTLKHHDGICKGNTYKFTITKKGEIPLPKNISLSNSVKNQSLIIDVGGLVEEAEEMVDVHLYSKDEEGKLTFVREASVSADSGKASATVLYEDYSSHNGIEFESCALYRSSCFKNSRSKVSATLLQLPCPSKTSYTVPKFNDNNSSFLMKSILPSNVSHLNCEVLFEIRHGHKVLAQTQVQKEPDISKPTSGSISLINFAENVPSQSSKAKFKVSSSLVSNISSYAASSFTSSDFHFKIASTPENVSVEYMAGVQNTLTVTWSLVAGINQYALQIHDKRSPVVVSNLVRSSTDKSKHFFHDTSSTDKNEHLTHCEVEVYSFSAQDMSKLSPGEIYTIHVYSVSDSPNVLSSIKSAEFPHKIRYFNAVKKLSVTYDAKADSVQPKFDSVPMAAGYFLTIMNRSGGRSQETKVDKIFIAAANASSFTLPLDKVRDKLTENGTYGIKISTVGNDYDIPSSYVEEEQMWNTAPSPGSISHSYHPDKDQLEVTCNSVKGYKLYKIYVQDITSKAIFSSSTGESSTVASFGGHNLNGNEFVCLAQTIGNPTTFSSNFCVGKTKLKRLPQLKVAEQAVYSIDCKKVKISFENVNHASSFYFQYSICDEAVVKNPSIEEIISKKTAVKILDDNFKPPLSDGPMVIQICIPDSFAVGNTLKLVGYAKGCDNYINGHPKLFESAKVKIIDAPKAQLKYNNKAQELSIMWDNVENSSSYEVNCNKSGDTTSIYCKSDISSNTCKITASRLTSMGATELFLQISAHSKMGKDPLLANNSVEKIRIADLFNNAHATQINVRTLKVTWTFEEEWKPYAKEIEVLIVFTSGKVEERLSVTGVKGYITICSTEELTEKSKLKIFSSYQSKSIVIGCPQTLTIPGKP